MFTLGFKLSRRLNHLMLSAAAGLIFVTTVLAQQALTVTLVNNPQANIVNGLAKTDHGEQGVSYTVWLQWQQPTGVKSYEVAEGGLIVSADTFIEPTEARAQMAIIQFAKAGTHRYQVKLIDDQNQVIGQGSSPSITVPSDAIARPNQGTGTTSESSGGTIKYISPDLSPLFKSRPYETFGAYLTDLVQVAMVISVVAATLVVVYAGFSYLTSGGSPEATAKGKEMIGGALIGLATVFLAAVFLVSLYSPEALAPPTESGGTAGQRGTLVNQLNAKLDKLKTLAQTAGVTLTPAQEQKLKSAIEKAASDGKPDAVKKAIQEVADEIAKQKPESKPIIDQQIGNVIKEVEKTFTESTPAQSGGRGDPTARAPSKRITQVDEQYLDDVTQFLAAAVTEEPCSLTFEHKRFELTKTVYARAHCSPPQAKYKSLLEAAQQLAAHAQTNEKTYEEIQKSITSSGYKACNLFILTATALTVDSGVSGKDLGSLERCPKANEFDDYFGNKGYQVIPLEKYRNNIKGIRPGDILQREVSGTGHVVIVEKIVVGGKQRKIQTIEASLGQLHPRRRTETFEFYLDERKFDNVIRKS